MRLASAISSAGVSRRCRRGLGEELIERVDGVVGERAVGVARRGRRAAEVVLDLDAARRELVAQVLDRLGAQPELLGELLDLGLADTALGDGAVEQRVEVARRPAGRQEGMPRTARGLRH